jgi:hypothetical protein
MPGRIAPRTLALLLGLCSLAALPAFAGIYEDREFCEGYFFLKHRPSFKLFFWAPAGESDMAAAGLPPCQAEEEKAYVEFIEHGGGFHRSVPLPFDCRSGLARALRPCGQR